MFHQAATQIHLSLFPNQVFTQRSFVNFHETSPMPFGRHPWTLSLKAKRTNFAKKREFEKTLSCEARFLLNFLTIRFVQRTTSKNICILLCPCNSRTTCTQTGGDVDLLIFLMSTLIFFVRAWNLLLKSLIKLLRWISIRTFLRRAPTTSVWNNGRRTQIVEVKEGRRWNRIFLVPLFFLLFDD